MVGDAHVYEAAMPVAAAMTPSPIQNTDVAPTFSNIKRHCGSYSEHMNRVEQENVDCVVPSGETENDTGYVSHDSRDDSSEHSVYMQSSETVALRTDQQLTQSMADDWLEVITEDNVSVQSMDNMDDLLYHFDKFFRDRFDSELFRFKSAMYEMLSEQQLHMRQIIHSVEMMPEENDVIFPDSGSSVPDNEENVSQSKLIQGNAMCKEKTKSRALLELMSLSCGVTALLNETKYRL
ncbi:uncharacterized protein LOC121370504 isoform X2 [Gigantopelta aegis]|nr:uncharacterized protein LOC121370504 isoform X2 [Gigantopelta aegis]